MSTLLITASDAAIIGRILLRREPSTDEVKSWSAQPYENGAVGFISEILKTDEFMGFNLDNTHLLARIYDAIMKRYDASLPVDIAYWVNLLNFEETIDTITKKFVSIQSSGYQNDPCGSPLDPSQAIKAINDADGRPVIFTYGTNKHLYLFKFNNSTNSYQQIDLSEALPSAHHTKVQSYDIYTDTRGNASVAVAVCERRGVPVSTLYITYPIGASTDAVGWINAFKSINVASGIPQGAVISNVSFSANDGANTTFVIASLAVQGVMNNYYFDMSTPAAIWQFLRIPQDADKTLLSKLGSYIKPGIWSLYYVNKDVALTFSSFQDKYGKTINYNYDGLPANTVTFVVSPGSSNVPNMYVGGDGISVYRSSHSNPETVLLPEAAKGISFLKVSITAEEEFVWYIDNSQSLKLVSKLNGATAWGNIEIVDTAVSEIAVVESGVQTAVTFAAITPSRALEIRVRNLQTAAWTSTEIPSSAVWDEMPLSLKELQTAIKDAAPIIYLDTEEQYKSSTVEFYLRKVGLWNTVKSTWELPKGSLWDNTANDMTSDALIPRARSANDGSTKHSSDYTLKIDDADYPLIIPGHPDDAPLYVHAKFIPEENSTDLVFWIFYPYNGPGTLSLSGKTNVLGNLGVHEGDWEHVLMRVDNDSKQVTKVYLSQHDSGDLIPKSVLETDPSTGRIVLYSSRNGHAFYSTPGANQKVLFDHLIQVSLQNATSKGAVLNTYEDGRTQLVSAQFLGAGAPVEPKWLNFPWRWGKYSEMSSSDVSDAIKSCLESIEPPGGILSPIINEIIGAILGKIAVDKNLLGGEGNSAGPQPIKFKDSWFSKE
ncbi:Vps62-related protein [Adhaeribacter rhizoryzae]|uniref:DUF946 domain-containing protein n=1 Tax=Adhaeribacter rhizoryzae TaxID=2607907 RepID=A0A5M6DJU3_9BACT|nr:Vps62-related protein [Adhaeribacter rhizoryzae]KAA5547818.1 DUF946 domain-containing protein [Adhaeribacter rhizoryzae]